MYHLKKMFIENCNFFLEYSDITFALYWLTLVKNLYIKDINKLFFSI